MPWKSAYNADHSDLCWKYVCFKVFHFGGVLEMYFGVVGVLCIINCHVKRVYRIGCHFCIYEDI